MPLRCGREGFHGVPLLIRTATGRGPGGDRDPALPASSLAPRPPPPGVWAARRAPGRSAGPPAPHTQTPGAPPTGVHIWTSSLPGSHGALPSRRPEAMRWAGTPQMAVWGRGGDPLRWQFPFLTLKTTSFPSQAWPVNNHAVLTAFLNRSSSFSAKSEAILETGVVARFT